MAPYCSTARWMPLHKGLYAQEPQYWHEAEQPISITFGRLSEGGLRSTCALKQLLSCTKDNHPGQTSKSHLRLRFCICQASNQAAFTPQAHCTWMKDGEMFHRGEPFPQAEWRRQKKPGLDAWFSPFIPKAKGRGTHQAWQVWQRLTLTGEYHGQEDISL